MRDTVRRFKKADAEGHRHLTAEAEKAMAIDGAVAQDLTHFTDDPRLLPRTQAAVARLIERAGVALTQN